MLVYIPSAEQKPGVWPGGQVHEILRDPPDGDYPKGDYRLWVGTATIERSASYSHFPRTERLHALLSGDGLRLHFRQPDASIALATQKFATFSGERPLVAEVLGTPVFAFNLIYRQGLTSGAEFVPLARASYVHAPDVKADHVLTQIVYVISGIVVLQSADGERLLDQGDTLCWDVRDPATEELCFQSQTADALLLFAHISDPRPQPTTSA